MNDFYKKIKLGLKSYLTRHKTPHFLFFIATIFAISIIGYYFGTNDHAIHIPFLKKFADSSLYKGDSFLDLRYYYYSFFWFIFIPFYKANILEPVMFIVHFLSVYATFWMLWRLSKLLFGNIWVSFLTIIVFIIPHTSLSGFPIIEFQLINRSFVLPFLLYSIEMFLSKKYVRSFMILGLLYNLHVLSVMYALGMLIFYIIFHLRKFTIMQLSRYFFAFIIPALPVFLWKLSNSSVDFSVDRAWANLITKSIFGNIFIFFLPSFEYVCFILGGIGIFGMLVFSFSHISKSKKGDMLRYFLYAVLLMVSCGFLFTSLYPSTIIMQLQLVRSVIFAMIFIYMIFASILVSLYQKGKINSFDFWILIIAFIFSPSPFIFLSAWVIYSIIRIQSIRIAVGIVSFVLLFGFAIWGFYTSGGWKPEVHIYHQNGDWEKVQLWAKNNTNSKALFITPPQKWWLYDTEWRVLSERSSVAQISDLLEIIFIPSYMSEWSKRFDDVAPSARLSFDGDAFRTIQSTNNAYNSLTKDDFIRLSKKYNASYVVVERSKNLSFEKMYENNSYKVYDLNVDK